MAVGSLTRAREFVGDVARCPRLLPLVGTDAQLKLPVAHLGLSSLSLRTVERAPRGPPRCVGLDLARPGRGAQSSRLVLLAGQFAVRGNGRRTCFPGASLGTI